MNRRAFLTLVAVSPALKVYSAATKPKLTFDELVRVTLRKYRPLMKQILNQHQPLMEALRRKYS
jgi:hypothetical protein